MNLMSTIIGLAVSGFVSSLLLPLWYIAFDRKINTFALVWLFIISVCCGMTVCSFYKALL